LMPTRPAERVKPRRHIGRDPGPAWSVGNHAFRVEREQLIGTGIDLRLANALRRIVTGSLPFSLGGRTRAVTCACEFSTRSGRESCFEALWR
jgi:hypothetical protein